MSSLYTRIADSVSDLSKRQYRNCNSYGYGYTYGNNGCYYSGWYGYGRWILLAVILVVAFLVFLLVSCLNARRRRRRGVQPLSGTGWMAPAGHGQAQYTGNQNYNGNQSYPMGNAQQQYQPPSYAPPANHVGANADYYGQEGGVTAPAGTYQPQRGGDNVYAAPEGPPPGKKY